MESHYDASHEVRAKGAAFYAFSTDEEKRRREMEELKRAREETDRARREAGAVDVKPGESEGLAVVVGDRDNKGKEAARSRAMEKRKREIEERRKLVEAKRRKLKDGGKDGEVPAPVSDSAEKVDPFAAVEAATMPKSQKNKSKRDQKDKLLIPTLKPSTNAADDFLAALEQDLISKGK